MTRKVRQPAKAPFDPDWVVHPGRIFDEVVSDSGLTPRSWARFLGVTVTELRAIRAGKAPFTAEHARLVGLTPFAGPTRLWLRLIQIYEAGLAAGKVDT